MGSYVASGLTGAGGVNINAGILIAPTEIFITATALGDGRLITLVPSIGGGQPSLERWAHTGWIGLGSNAYPDSTTNLPGVVWWTFIEFNCMDLPLVIPAGFVDSLFWGLTQGVSVDLTVFW